MDERSAFESLLEVLRSGRGKDGKKKDVVFAPNIMPDSLEKKEVQALVRAFRNTSVRVISFPLLSGAECDSSTIPKRLRKMLGDGCSIGIIKRKRKDDITFIPAELFGKRWARNDVIDKNTELVK